MWTYLLRRLLYSIPVYLGIILFLMLCLRVNDPVRAYLGKESSQEAYDAKKQQMGLDRPFVVQYVTFLGNLATLDFTEESWARDGKAVGEILRESVGPSLAITLPAMLVTLTISVVIAIFSSYYRGRLPDRLMMVAAVLGMSISVLVYIILGQYWGAYELNKHIEGELFAVQGYEPGLRNWAHFCLLPVLISATVAVGYDTRFYRAVMVEESDRDYIVTARAKGASKRKIMFVHMLKNAMIPIVTRVMIELPFVIMGTLLLEVYFTIPGMGRALYDSIIESDFPVAQTLVALFAGVFVLSVLLTDICYALVDPRVRLS